MASGDIVYVDAGFSSAELKQAIDDLATAPTAGDNITQMQSGSRVILMIIYV